LACCQYVYEDAIGEAYKEKLNNIFDSCGKGGCNPIGLPSPTPPAPRNYHQNYHQKYAKDFGVGEKTTGQRNTAVGHTG